MKNKICLKEPLHNFIQRRNGKQWMSLRFYLLYCYIVMQSLFKVYKIWTFTFKIGLPNYPCVKGAEFPIRGPRFKSIQICRVKSRSRLIQPFIPLKLIKRVQGTPGDWVVKSKLSTRSGSVALRQLNQIYKKGHKVLHFFI